VGLLYHLLHRWSRIALRRHAAVREALRTHVATPIKLVRIPGLALLQTTMHSDLIDPFTPGVTNPRLLSQRGGWRCYARPHAATIGPRLRMAFGPKEGTAESGYPDVFAGRSSAVSGRNDHDHEPPPTRRHKCGRTGAT
jgi:hypothetical protein